MELNDEEFKADITALIPHLRAFARSLCGNATFADDLAQETLVKAWKARASFEAGTSMKAWTFMILRNHYYSEKRRSWRSTPLDSEMAENTLVAADNPSDSVELLSLRNAMLKLPEDQREALILVGAGGLPYEEVAQICGCAVGTIKSRVSRARKSLELMIESEPMVPRDGDRLSAQHAFDDILEQANAMAKGRAGHGQKVDTEV